MEVSFVVCCYNSVARLGPTLEHLSKQTLAGINAEVVLVDNNSSDGTAAFTSQCWQELGAPFSLSIVKEREPGLSYARTAGARAASGQYLIFCDDDNWLESGYAQVVIEIFKAQREVGIIGGLGKPHYEEEPPAWIAEASIVSRYALGPQGEEEGYTTSERIWVYGAGMAIRRDLFMKLAETKSYLSDRKGVHLNGGGDVEICFKALMQGMKIYYSPRLSFTHFIAKNRLTYQYQKKMVRGIVQDGLLIKGFKLRYSYPNGDYPRPYWWYYLKQQVVHFIKFDLKKKLIKGGSLNRKRLFMYSWLLRVRLVLTYRYELDRLYDRIASEESITANYNNIE